MPLSQRTHLAALLVVCAVVLLKCSHLILSWDDPYLAYRIEDEAYYHLWAGDISQGELLLETVFFTTPLFAYFLGGLYALLGDSLAVVRLANLVLGLGTCALLYLAARQTLERRFALVALTLYGACISPTFYETFPQKTALVMFLTGLALYLSCRALAMARSTAFGWLAAGAAIGATALAHALLLVLLPAVCGASLMRSPVPLRRRLLAVMWLGVGAGAAIAPATLHNYVAARELVLIVSSSGHNFYIGNHAGNETGYYTSPAFSRATISDEEAAFHKEAERRSGKPLTASEASAFWLHSGLREARDNPALSLQRWWRKLRWSLNNEEVPDTRTPAFYRHRLPVLRLPLLGFGWIAVLGLLGTVMVLASSDRARYAPHLLLVTLFCAAISLFFVYGRLRLPLLLPLAILAAAGAETGLRWMRRGAWRRFALPAVLAIPLGVFVFGDVLPSRRHGFFVEYLNHGARLYNDGRQEAAAVEFEKAIAAEPRLHPRRDEIVALTVEIYLEKERADDARRLLRTVLGEDAPHTPARFSLRQQLQRLEEPR